MPRKVVKPEPKLKPEFDLAILENQESGQTAIAQIIASLTMYQQLPDDLRAQALAAIDGDHLEEFQKDIQATKRKLFHKFVFGSLETKPTVKRAQKWLSGLYGEEFEYDLQKKITESTRWLREEKKCVGVFSTLESNIECRMGLSFLKSWGRHRFRFRPIGGEQTALRSSKTIPQNFRFDI